VPCAVFGSCQVQLAFPVTLERCEVASALPASLPVQETVPLTPLPVFAFLTVIETVNALPATALPTVSLPAFNFVTGGGGGGGGGGGAGAFTVIVRVAETLAPES